MQFQRPLALAILLPLMVVPGLAQTGKNLPFGALDASRPISCFVSSSGPGYRAHDRVLAQWALQAWEKAAGGGLQFQDSHETSARLRVYWVSAQGGGYGEMRPLQVEGKRAAAIFVRPELEGLGPRIVARARHDPLFRDTVIYLTCLHELGHGLGLEHTANYEDIMFYFGFGGDIENYFMRYREKLEGPGDIRGHSGLSRADVRRLRQLYPPRAKP